MQLSIAREAVLTLKELSSYLDTFSGIQLVIDELNTDSLPNDRLQDYKKRTCYS